MQDANHTNTTIRNPYHRYVAWTLGESAILALLGLLIAYFADNVRDLLLGLGVAVIAVGVFFSHKKFFSRFAKEWDQKNRR